MHQLPLWDGNPPLAALQPPPESGPITGPVSALELGKWLSARVGRPVSVVLTQNRSTMLSYRQTVSGLQLRLHSIFATAGEALLTDLADYLADRGGREVAQRLDDFIAQNPVRRLAEPVELREAGRFHHLRDIWAELNGTYFHNASQARITWGTASSRRYRRTIQLGCFVAEQKLIRMHPALDQVFVPRHYVAWIVFHEMLHEVFGVEQRGGRRCVHPPEFAAIEQSYVDYHRCKAWEAQNLHRLLRYRPNGRG